MKSTTYLPLARKKSHEISLPKSDWIPWNPSRYVWHISYGGTLIENAEEKLFFHRLSYATEGIGGKDKGLGGVWVNNQMRRIHDLWPVWIDRIWDCYSDIDYLQLLYSYDVWRIDTRLVDNPWYLDPNLMEEREGSEFARDYLYCEKSIHPLALKLFTFKLDDYTFLYRDKWKAKFELEPVENINLFINHKWK